MGQPPSVRADGPPPESIGGAEGTAGTETSQYREEEESSERPVVVASEPGCCLNRGVFGPGGVVGPSPRRRKVEASGVQWQPKRLGGRARGGESPVGDGWTAREWDGT